MKKRKIILNLAMSLDWYICDGKLANKRKWIKNNRWVYLPQVLDILLSN